MENIKTYTLALSRWHTVANRLNAHAEGLFEHAVRVLESTHAQHEISEAQRVALAARGEQALCDINVARASLRAAARIRAELASANAAHGVSAKLAEAEGLRREIQKLAQLQQIDLLSKVALDDANSVLGRRTSDGGMMGGRLSAVSLALVPLDALDGHQRDKDVLDRAQQELMDEVNTLNRNTLSIELDRGVAVHAGL